jgi:hypothetical protein
MVLQPVTLHVQCTGILSCEYSQIHVFLELKIPVLILYTCNMTQKYIMANNRFTCCYNAVGVSSVNYVYLLTRTREKQRQRKTSTCLRHEVKKKRRKIRQASSVTSLSDLFCAPSAPVLL